LKTIGLIGGLSWESSAEYYRIINQTVQKKLGGLHSAKSLLYSFDFAQIEELQHQGEWESATQMMLDAARSLQKGGADLILICANTMHKMADTIQAQVDLPLLHIADATAQQIVAANFKKIGLLGTIYTMEHDFYKGRLTQKYGLEVIVPTAEERQLVNRVIYDELCQGLVKPESRLSYKQIIANLVAVGAEAIILGCTELMLLVKPEDSTVPLFDTTTIHAETAALYALT
jgi:aspartate racemase